MYELDDPSAIPSPALVVFREHVEGNLDEMIRVAGSADRLRPHCKTHKMAAVTRIELDRGITRHKAATFAEAEMLAEAGVPDVFLAYNVVGPNVARAVAFRERYPNVTFAVAADDPGPVATLAEAMRDVNQSIDVMLDVDCGMHRTGIPPGNGAARLYRTLHETDGVRPAGLHVYDGQTRAEPLEERIAAIRSIWSEVAAFRERLEADGLEVPRIIAGGTPSFTAWVTIDDPVLEYSPGTCVFHDHGYGSRYRDQQFTPAALVLTRVVSRTADDLLTLDAGTKSVAPDPPLADRLRFPDLPDAEFVKQNEEHLVVRTPAAAGYRPGDVLLAIPGHVCPTCALHRDVWVVENGRVTGQWLVTARDRKLTI